MHIAASLTGLISITTAFCTSDSAVRSAIAPPDSILKLNPCIAPREKHIDVCELVRFRYVGLSSRLANHDWEFADCISNGVLLYFSVLPSLIFCSYLQMDDSLAGRILALAGDRSNRPFMTNSIISRQQVSAGTSVGGPSNQAVDDEYVTDLRDSDCLLGRGTGPNNHQGNIEFRDAVNDLKRAYVATASRKAKKRLVQEAVQAVQQVKNGRFLSKLTKSELKRLKLCQPKRYERIMENANKGSTARQNDAAISPGTIAIYKIVPDEVAMEKTKQALRYICYKKDARSGVSVHSNGADEGDDKSVGSSDGEAVDRKNEKKLTKKAAVNKKGSSDGKHKKSNRKRKKQAPSSSDAITSSPPPLGSKDTASKPSTKDQELSTGKVSGSIGAFLASPRHKRQTVAGHSYGLLPGVGSPEALFAANPSLAALPPSFAAAISAGHPLGTHRMLENTETLIASALANTAVAPAPSGLVVPTINGGSLAYDQRMAMASSLLASRSLPWTPATATVPSADVVDREILLAAALQQQQNQERLAALQQQFLG